MTSKIKTKVNQIHKKSSENNQKSITGKKVMRSKELTDIVKKDDNKKFVIVGLDDIRDPDGKVFKTSVDAKDVKNAIEVFYTRFPNGENHIMVVPEEYVVEHTGYVSPKMIIKIQKKLPLIKLV